jgi:hypothetical protein
MHDGDSEDRHPQVDEELPRRRRARILTPFTVMLMFIVFAAAGFVAGALVEKHQTKSATIVGAAATGGFGPAASTSGATGASGANGAPSRLGGLFGGGSAGTIGTVTDIKGRTLYVTTTAGTMVEVLTTSTSKITKTESVGKSTIRPGDSVVVSGITATNGTVTASTVSDSGSASSSGGISSLFGAGSATTTSGGSSSSLFGR